MLKKQTVTFQTLSFISLSYILAGCFPIPEHAENKQNVPCAVSKTCLSFQTETTRLNLSTDIITVENMYDINLISSKPVKTVHLVSKNMQMGTVYLPLSNKKLNEKAANGTFTNSINLFLGMCSEPIMEWQLIITFEDDMTESTWLKSYWSRQYVEKR